MFLGELTYPVGWLEGVGNAAMRDLGTLGVTTVADLLRHYPFRYEDRKTPVLLAHSRPDRPAVTVATVLRHEIFRWKRGMTLKIIVEDESAEASLLCYGREFLGERLPPETKIYLTGRFEPRFGELQSAGFVFEPWSEHPKEFGNILPVYPLAGSLKQGTLRRAMKGALRKYIVGLREELPAGLRSSRGLPSKSASLQQMHFPDDLEAAGLAREALIFEEFFHLQFAVARRGLMGRGSGSRFAPGHWSQALIDRLKGNLPFTLTADQERCLDEIRRDMTFERPMNRLLHGEVGSGKTLVALMASLGLIGAGKQVALMAPTELLARQHADVATRLLEPLGIRVAFLSGDVTSGTRRTLLEELEGGEIDLLAGTHALFSKDVVFKSLGLVIVDEQQRFGVIQRKALSSKGLFPDVLAMTATPIPRTLALTIFGDMDISSIRILPSGRRAIETHLVRMGNEHKVYSFVRRELDIGHRAYFVYPLIEESETLNMKNAENMYRELNDEIFPEHRCALLHSKINEDEKSLIMEKFRSGELNILVATSVVEVGVDIPEATCMVVEHAERFGLCALHQLRGRIGRSERPSFCFLIYAEPLTDEGKSRLRIMKKTHDGFVIAEEDFKMRGPGDLTGTRQSGFLGLKIADPLRDTELLLEARREAKNLLEQDPGLLDASNTDLRELWNSVPPFNEELLATG